MTMIRRMIRATAMALLIQFTKHSIQRMVIENTAVEREKIEGF
jgi:hypothetical protein